MEKFCVFCGSKPESKNKEHILPQWLIKMRDDPNREIYLGRKWNSPSLEKWKFSFSKKKERFCVGKKGLKNRYFNKLKF